VRGWGGCEKPDPFARKLFNKTVKKAIVKKFLGKGTMTTWSVGKGGTARKFLKGEEKKRETPLEVVGIQAEGGAPFWRHQKTSGKKIEKKLRKGRHYDLWL